MAETADSIHATVVELSFILGTWQVQRLDWKTKLIAKFEDRLVKPPLPPQESEL
jgi:surfeit locus 1 family protein